MEKFIKVVREDEEVGLGSCSFIDECWEDKDIVEYLQELVDECDHVIDTPEQAVKEMRHMESCYHG